MTKQHNKDMGSCSFVQYLKTVIFTSLFSVIHKKHHFYWNFSTSLSNHYSKRHVIYF